MKKIRINELARELEVKPGVILDMLPGLGVQEKKTHSSSVDEDVALELRRRLTGPDAASLRSSNGHHEDDRDDEHEDFHASADQSEEHDRETVSPTLTAPPPIEKPANKEPEPKAASVTMSSNEPLKAAVRPPLTPNVPLVQDRPIAQQFRATPIPPATIPVPPATIPVPPATQPAQKAAAANEPAAEAEPRPAPSFRPLRPPMFSGGAIQPPLATPAAPGTPSALNRSISIPARPLPTAPRPATPPPGSNRPATTTAPAPPATQSGTPVMPSGPRQPMPTEPVRPNLGVPAPPTVQYAPSRPPAPGPERPAPPRPSPETPARPQAAQPLTASPGAPSAPPITRLPQVPTHVVAPGPAQASSSTTPTAPTPAPAAPSSIPGAPIPPRPTVRMDRPGVTPGSPIAPRPQNVRPPLAGQPQARPVVPPRPDLVQRLKQQQVRPPAAPPAPSIPRPGAPAARTSPTPGQPLYSRPPRPGQAASPGQPQMRGPGGYPQRPNTPGGYAPRPGGPGGPRPPHATALRPESAQPLPTGQQQRRFQPKPGVGRNAGRKREFEEGNLRERVSKRNQLAEPPPIDREITVAEGVTVKELSEKLGVKANLVVKKLVEKKIFATINQTLDVKLAEELAREFGASTNQVSYEEESTQDIELAEEPADLVRRAPVVTIMGHVDHGKTSLLDAIRETNVAGREAGGITQHIGAYHIERNNRKIVFIDTPGHQAFTRMRSRGAKITDIVVLVVSADDGVMPQTLEAIDHARAAKVPIIVAINKIDKPDATPERVKQQLADRGLLAEDWGGDVVMVPVSAKTGQNLDLLLEMILIVADLQDLKANPARPAIGNVLEAKLDKGRGPVATMLVRNGTLKVGDFFICGALFSKVRAMFDDRGNPVREAEPSMPVEVIGLESLPEVGDSFQVTSDTSKAKQIVIYREAKARDVAMAKGARVATLDSLHQQFKEGDLKDFNLIIKADVGGTAEVLSDTLTALSNDKIRVRVLHAGVGAISESDVLLASTSEALVVGFNVRPDRSAQAAAEQAKVEIRLHSIIYELIDEVKLAMTGLLDPVYKETVQGHIEVKEIFKISKVGTVAGCYVTDGLVRRDSQVRVIRDGEVIHTGKIEALKRFKNDASEVKNGTECGISLANYNNVLQGDIFEAFTMERIMPEAPVSRA